MKNILLIILFLNGIYCFGQDYNELKNYNWKTLVKVTLFDLGNAEFESDSLLFDTLDKHTTKTNCTNIRRWRLAFSTLPKGPNKDILGEKTHILLCEFDNGQRIPLRFFPGQKTVYDLREDYGYYHSFPEKSNLINQIFSKCHDNLTKNGTQKKN